MDDVRVGRLLRALRHRKGMRQVDIAVATGLSQQAISLIERGHLSTLSIRVLRRAFAAVDARFDAVVSWRGGQVDRLLDERHASLVGQVANELVRLGWQVHVEVTFSEYGERGSIDVLAVQPGTRVALVVEVKTMLTAIDDTIRRLDVKDRLGARIVLDRLGWRPLSVGRMLVVLDSSTNRRRVTKHAGSMERAFVNRGRGLRTWLRAPIGPVSGLRFVSPTNVSGARRRNPASRAGPGTRPPPDTTRIGI